MADTTINYTGSEIAVIGIAGRFPGAKDVHEFWENLKNGVESLSFISDGEFETLEVPPGWKEDPNYVRAKGGVLEDKEFFDASFFGYTQREAEIMDPQMRIFHECAWAALEDAGYDPVKYPGSIGLYAGAGTSSFWEYISLSSGRCEELGYFASGLLYDKDFLSTKIGYNLGLKGPCFSVQTACSTSLVALHLACQGILNGECNMALAGGIKIVPREPAGYLYREGMIYSPDGRCKPFDVRAQGTVGGEGAGVVLLKPLEDAVSHGDHIYAVIKGTAINNDGLRKVGYTAPSIEGQAEVIRMAHRMAEIEPESIGYIEAHGTGTPLGDPVEIEALKVAFNTRKKKFTAVGSVKSNIGHLDAAAGVAGFIKAVLTLTHRQIPPSLHFEKPNPRIDFENSPFYVNDRLTSWESNGSPRRAGVSSFGIGGTNAHAILEEWSAEPGMTPAGDPGYRLIPLSAKTMETLDRLTANLHRYFIDHRDISLSDAAFTLAVGRREFQCRRAFVCRDMEQAIDKLSNPGSAEIHTFQTSREENPVIFMFPGLGTEYENMAGELYREEPLFREEADRCFQILKPLIPHDIKEILYPGEANAGAPNQRLKDPEAARLALFIVEYALARLLIKWGIQPGGGVGYGFGEYAAACVSGKVSLEDTLKSILSSGKSAGEPMPGNIRFSDGIKESMKKENALLVVVGPGQDLCVLLESFNSTPGRLVLDLIRPPEQNISDTFYLLNSIGQLWSRGCAVDWNKFYAHGEARRVSLPAYPFERERYWYDDSMLKNGLNLTGGTDRGKEAAPVFKARPQLMNPYTAPGSPSEEAIALEWQRLFGYDRVGVDDNFYDLGGDSVMAVTLVSLINKAGFRASLADVLSNATVRKLAAVIGERKVSEEIEMDIYEERLLSQLECIERLNRGRNPKNIFIIHALHGMVNQYNRLAVLIEKKYNVYGVQAMGLKPGTAPAETPDQMIDRYLEQILAVQKEGPFILGGYCNGAHIAYEIVKKLENLNHTVENLIFFDSYLFFPDRFLRILRALEYLPRIFRKIVISSYDRNFKKAMQAWKSQESEHPRSGTAGGGPLSRESFQEHMNILSKHILTLELIKSPIYAITAERSTRTRITEADFSRMTRGKVTAVKTPGDHDSILEDPDVQNVARIILEM